MSNNNTAQYRKKETLMTINDPLSLDRYAGRPIPGGCDDCGAYQTLDVSEAPLYVLQVHHDDTCPAYWSMKGKLS